jgi:hypothetical protein
MKANLNIIVFTLMSLMIISSCANKKGEKFLEEIEKPEESVSSFIEEQSSSNDNLIEENNAIEVTFSNFLSYFPEKTVPFNLKDISFTSYIESDFVLEFIDSEYLNKDSLEIIEAGEDEESYTPLNYAYAAKIEIKGIYLLAYYQIRENIGPSGNYILATYDKEGVFLDSLNFDVFNVYLEGSEEVIVHGDSLTINVGDNKEVISINEQGNFIK